MITLLAVLVVSMFAAPIQDAGVSGVWDVRLSADWTTLPDLVCTLSQKGADLGGRCKAAGDAQGKGVELTGKVDGDKISCQWKVPTPDGATWTFVVTGTTDTTRAKMKGTFKVSNGSGGGGEGTFSASRR